jgi:hypothetical protein
MEAATTDLDNPGVGMAMGWVDRKPDPWKNVIGLNLTPEPVGFRVGFGCPSGFINRFLLGFFYFFSVFFFWVSDFLGFWVHLRVKNKTRTQTRFWTGQIWITGVKKMYLNPHPSGVKPTGYPKHEPELPSLPTASTSHGCCLKVETEPSLGATH